MNKPLLFTCRNAPLPDAKAHRLRSIVQVFLVVTLCGSAMYSVAATQGEWGRSSTATANITLRILPRDHGDSVKSVNYLTDARDEAQGYRAVQDHCNSSSSFNRAGNRFNAELLTDSGGDNLERLLRASCAGRGTDLPAVAGDTAQKTILISPL